MNQYGYALLGLTAIVVMLVGVLMVAVLKLASGARGAGSSKRRDETALLSSALQDAMARLQAQERAMNARAVASEKLSSQIVESLTAGLLVVGETGRVNILNPTGRALLGVTDDVAGTDYRELLSSAPPLRDAVAECLAGGNAIVRRTIEIPGAGRPSYFGVSVSPLGTDHAGAICLFADLTNVVELEEQLRLKEALARVGELTAGIAHEFRNGLATIHGYSRLLTPEALPAAYRPHVEGIRNETEALGQIVTNFLRFARPETVSFAPVSLGPLVKRAGDDLLHELPAGTTIEMRGTFGDVQGDEILLKQVFGNLLRNAAEACDSVGTRPVISVDGDVDRRRGSCGVSISDNGPGIPEAARGRVFQPFFTTRSRGTGLGLAIVQKIVVTHNGRVTVGASASGGARIDLMFPLIP
jgi:two-component system sensor histidine kinase PilS (NtrC family)